MTDFELNRVKKNDVTYCRKNSVILPDQNF